MNGREHGYQEEDDAGMLSRFHDQPPFAKREKEEREGTTAQGVRGKTILIDRVSHNKRGK